MNEDNLNLVSMWKELEELQERYELPENDPWVWTFLKQALNASTLPPYHFMSRKNRDDLSDRIDSLSKELLRVLKNNALDFHIVFIEKFYFNGFYLFENFSEETQSEIEADGTEKLQVSELLKGVAERSKEAIVEEPLPGKAGKNA
ncbi:MAG: hypothetical protein JRF37_09380, partial [Deltaproteobacteria bacterium]|nr:hypothetical protein [Deltaproteobacteria bacterium]